MSYSLDITVNSVHHELPVAAADSLLAVLRDGLGLTGSKEGCDDSECGACMVLIDGRPVNSCSFLALQAAGREVITVEGLADGYQLHPIQQAFLDAGGVQCGFCTPGMLVSVKALLDANPSPTISEISQALSGNLCRCTGYQKIVRAVASVAGPAQAVAAAAEDGNTQEDPQMTRIVLLGRLRNGVDRATYERWVVERDYPFVRSLSAIAAYRVSRVEGFLFGTDARLDAGYDYAEIIDVPDLDAYLAAVGTEDGKRFLDEWSTFIEDFVAVQGPILE